MKLNLLEDSNIPRVFVKADKESKRKGLYKWDDLYHYDIALNSSIPVINGCVELLVRLME